MIFRDKIISIAINAAIFIILEVAAINLLIHNNRLQNFIISQKVHYFMGHIWGFSQNINKYMHLNKENEELVKQIFDLNKELNKYKINNQEYIQSINTKEFDSLLNKNNYNFISASIIKLSTNKQHNYFIINKGSADGVKNTDGVITHNGAIGIVEATSEHYAYCMSFKNSNLSISARIGLQGPVGPLTWDGKKGNTAILSEIPLHNKVVKGDTVYTSGYSSIFPADIPIAKIDTFKVVNGATYQIKVSLLAILDNIRYVTIVENNNKLEIKELEKQNEK